MPAPPPHEPVASADGGQRIQLLLDLVEVLDGSAVVVLPAACADIPEIPVRNSGIPEIIRDFLLARLSRVILP